MITYYDDGNSERIELSSVSFNNWVHKTANLLVDELLIEPGNPVALPLARDAPAHWTTLAWVAAIWRVGCPVVIGSGSDAPVEVVGPDAANGADIRDAAERVACSLHPLGLGFDQPLPQDVLDYGQEVHSQPDIFTGPLPPESAPAWSEDDDQLTQEDAARGFADRSAIRTMIARRHIAADDEPIWPIVRRALVEPVITGGSVVVFIGTDAARRQAVADSERVDRRD